MNREETPTVLVTGAATGIGLATAELLAANELRLQLEVNTIAPIPLEQGVLPQLHASGGRMIFMGAGQGRAALPYGGPYGTSKAALSALTFSPPLDVVSHSSIASPATSQCAIGIRCAPLSPDPRRLFEAQLRPTR